MSSTWIISTKKTAKEVADAIRPLMDQQDLLLVAEMGKQYEGWLPEKAWEWLRGQMHQPSLMDIIHAQSTTTTPQPSFKALADLIKSQK